MEKADQFFKVAKVDDVKPGEGKIVRAGIKKLALFQVDGVYYCIQNFCPHAGGALGLGEINGHIVKCPRHSWGFDMRNGECLTNPRYCVKEYEVKVEGDYICVGVPNDDNLL